MSVQLAVVNDLIVIKRVFVFYREIYRVTESLQRERASLLKQLDLLR